MFYPAQKREIRANVEVRMAALLERNAEAWVVK